jgi:hypothetical protein
MRQVSDGLLVAALSMLAAAGRRVSWRTVGRLVGSDAAAVRGRLADPEFRRLLAEQAPAAARALEDRLETLRRRATSDHPGPAPLPAAPTGHGPGTPQKVAAMEARAAAGQALFHPLDAGWEARAVPPPVGPDDGQDGGAGPRAKRRRGRSRLGGGRHHTAAR